LGWKILLFALLMAMISAIPNVEYNIDVNFRGIDFWSLVFLIVGTFYNVVPKFVATVEREHRLQLAKLSLSQQSIFQNKSEEKNQFAIQIPNQNP
jgi:hypothetical protein